MNGKVFRVQTLGKCIVAQIPQADARDHPDCKGESSLAKLLLRLLGSAWVDGGLLTKQDAGRLWIPCLAADEVEGLFSSGRLAEVKTQVWEAITFWNDARLVEPGASLPFPEGEVFFKAEQWNLLDCQSELLRYA